MIQFFESVLDFFKTVFGVLLQIFTGFWNMLSMIGKSIGWLTGAVLYLPSFVQGTIMIVISIMVVYLIISRGESEN